MRLKEAARSQLTLTAFCQPPYGANQAKLKEAARSQLTLTADGAQPFIAVCCSPVQSLFAHSFTVFLSPLVIGFKKKSFRFLPPFQGACRQTPRLSRADGG